MNHPKNYYQVLEIGREVSEKEIKSAYRRLAFRYHPDRNPGNRDALERFKGITEAYGVLVDPIKRREYDQYLLHTERVQSMSEDFKGYPYGDLLRDIFGNADAREVFEQMAMGGDIRMDEKFLRQLLSGGFIFGGIFFGFWGISPIGFKPHGDTFRFGNSPATPIHLLQALVAKFIGGVMNTVRQVKGFWDSIEVTPRMEDKIGDEVNLMITREEARRGTSKQVELKTQGAMRKYRVKIPSGIGNGARLRIKEQDGKAFLLHVMIED